MDKKIGAHEIHLKIDSNVVNTAVVEFVEKLGLIGGSTGDIELYELLQAYLLKPECRTPINRVVSEYVHKN